MLRIRYIKGHTSTTGEYRLLLPPSQPPTHHHCLPLLPPLSWRRILGLQSDYCLCRVFRPEFTQPEPQFSSFSISFYMGASTTEEHQEWSWGWPIQHNWHTHTDTHTHTLVWWGCCCQRHDHHVFWNSLGVILCLFYYYYYFFLCFCMSKGRRCYDTVTDFKMIYKMAENDDQKSISPPPNYLFVF